MLTPAQLLDQQKKANATMIELEERRIEKMQRRQVTRLVVARSYVEAVGVGLAPPSYFSKRKCLP